MIRKILKGILTLYRWIRSAFFNLLFIVLLLAILSSLFSSETFEITPGSALVIAPNGYLVEQRSQVDSFSDLLGGNPARHEIPLQDMLDVIDIAADDDEISAIVLRLDALQNASLNMLHDIGQALSAFKSSGKPVFAVADNLSQSQYYLASFADEILLNEMGLVNLEGFSSYQFYFAEAIEKLGINVHIFRVGEYKSAVEPFELNGMSEAARENYEQLLGERWQFYLENVGAQRQLTPEQINDLINNQDQYLAEVNGDSAQLALRNGLVDQVTSRPGMRDYLISRIAPNADNSNFLQVAFEAYLAKRRPPFNAIPASNQVGVIVASGTILDGQGEAGSIGGDSLSILIRQARDDANIKALVLRIDSPGGSAYASEVIRQQLLDFKQSGKPLLVSMGGVAASGGYWIATAADQIWASEGTITGSIGIFGIIPGFSESLARLGIYTDGVGTTEQAGALSLVREMPESTRNAIQLIIEKGYERFLTIVAEARNMSTEDVDAIGQGRVWSALAAQQFGLVDNIGDLEAAVAAAADQAGLERYQTRVIAEPPSAAELFLRNLSDSLNVRSWFAAEQPLMANTLINELYRELDQELGLFLQLNDPGNLYLQCFVCARTP
jgi:protease-4